MKLPALFNTLLYISLGGMLACQPQAADSETTSEAEAAPPPATIGEIERLDPALDALIPEGTEIEVLAEGFDWSEGPLWVPELEAVIFSDIPPNSIFQWKEGEGKSLYLKPSGFTGEVERRGEPGSNGLLLDAEGNLVLCQHGDRRMAMMDAPLDAPEPNFITLADSWDDKRLNSPNDAAFHSNGDLYFTDPPYGLEENVNDPAKEIPFQGVYKVSPDGEVTLLTDELSRPNGIAFSPDEQTLYVANSDPERPVWMAYDVQEDGTLANGRVFLDTSDKMSETRRGVPDGMKVDQNGNLFATAAGGVWVISPEGKHLGTILTTQATSNCAFGDDGSTLYITADMYLLRVKLNTQGMGF